MKKLSTILILSLAVQLCFGCNDSVPNWGESLGVVGFKTNQTWIVGNQEWSDVVMATACQKETFADFDKYAWYVADCRSNPNYGDLFSWCAVFRFQNELCPDDWRVPTLDDFVSLDIVLKGFGKYPTHYYDDTIVHDKYLNIWGGSYGGVHFGLLGLRGQGTRVEYWSQSSDNYRGGAHQRASALSLWSERRLVSTNNVTPKQTGLMLRCVRNIQNQNENKK